jgi:uncharacterized protein (TIGR03663 family)
MTDELEKETTNDKRGATDYFWLLNCTLITIVASFLRFYWLELKPLHHDEGVNGYFLTNLFRNGEYKYDPANYHGPDLYYIALAFSKIFGLQTISIRASVAIFGVLTVIMAFFLKRYIGKIGSLAAALFLSLSPGMVFISRYFIHEILFVFFSFGIVVSILYFIEKRKAGVVAIASMTALLLVCFLPSVINLSNLINVENQTLFWIIRGGFFLIEAVLVLFVMRMILSWNDGRPVYLLLASASTVLLFATKETAFITVATMLIACVCVWIWRRIYAATIGDYGEDDTGKTALTWANFREGLGVSSNAEFILVQSAVTSIAIFAMWLFVRIGIDKFLDKADDAAKGIVVQSESFLHETDYAILAIASALLLVSVFVWIFRKPQKISTDFVMLSIASMLVFLYVGILFFSSFFTYPQGIRGAFEAYSIWTKTGAKEHTQNGMWAYVRWGMKIESPIMILSAIGTLIALLKARHRFAIFTGFWAFGMFAAYTIIPYKTPWLALSFLLPMCIVAGYGVGEMLRANDIVLKILGGLVAMMAVFILSYQTYDLNFVRYDDEERVYVYAHTKRGFLDLIKQIEHYSEKSGKGKEATIEIVSPDYWSMPWYMNDYPHANFNGHLVDANTAEMIVAKKDEQDAEVVTRYTPHYKYVGTYPLRPGVDLMLLVRRDLADPDAQEIDKAIYQIGDDVVPMTVTPDDDASPEKTKKP